MNALVDLLPVIAFFAAYKLSGIHTAIIVIMAAVALQVAVTWLIKRTVSRMLLLSAGLVVVFGGISLIFNDALIFKWKPTVLNWGFAAVFLGSQVFGGKPLIQRVLQSVSTEAIHLDDADWRRLNLMWVAFFLVSGAANIYVAYSYPEATWVNFKLFGLMGMTLVFVLLQGAWLSNRVKEDPAAGGQ